MGKYAQDRKQLNMNNKKGRMSSPTFIDLFAGSGGLSLGLEQAGFQSIFFNEIEPVFASTYMANRKIKKGHYYVGDINKLNEELGKFKHIWENIDGGVDLVCGGPPCQGFSSANRQRVIDDPRNGLYKAYLKFLSAVRPKVFIMENVKGMAQRIDEIKDNFKEYLGEDYLFEARILKAQDFGVPQNRERLIFIGNRLGINPADIFTAINAYRRTPFMLGDALRGLPHLEA